MNIPLWPGGATTLSPRERNGFPFVWAIPLFMLVIGGSAFLALVVASLELKWMVASVGALGLVFGLLMVRDRRLLILVILVLSFQAVLHKTFGLRDLDISGGPQSVYFNSIDALLVVLYGFWFFEGTLIGDLRRLLSQPIFFLPLAVGIAVLPSAAIATNMNLAVGELIRIIMAYALYVYVAARVRDRREVASVLGALFLVVIIQSIVVFLQWRTGTSLGLDVIGEQSALGVRSLDDSEIPRPSGTVIHSTLLGAIVGATTVLALSLTIGLRHWALRLACFATVCLGGAIIAIAQTRGAAIAMVAAVLPMAVVYLRSGKLPWRAVFIALTCAALMAFVYREQIADRVFANLGTNHFNLEVQARLELNEQAIEMIADHPLLGVGLNNSELVGLRYDLYGMIFGGHPVHNIYLLVAAESGIIGLLGLLITLYVFIVVAVRLARTKDPFLSAMGIGIAAVHLFFLVEEMLMFSFRHDASRSLYWLLAGLSVACWRIAQEQQREARLSEVAV